MNLAIAVEIRWAVLGVSAVPFTFRDLLWLMVVIQEWPAARSYCEMAFIAPKSRALPGMANAHSSSYVHHAADYV